MVVFCPLGACMTCSPRIQKYSKCLADATSTMTASAIRDRFRVRSSLALKGAIHASRRTATTYLKQIHSYHNTYHILPDYHAGPASPIYASRAWLLRDMLQCMPWKMHKYASFFQVVLYPLLDDNTQYNLSFKVIFRSGVIHWRKSQVFFIHEGSIHCKVFFQQGPPQWVQRGNCS